MRGFLSAILVCAFAVVAIADEKKTTLDKKVSDWHKVSGHGDIFFDTQNGDYSYNHSTRMMERRDGSRYFPVKRDSAGRQYVEGQTQSQYPSAASNCPTCPTCPYVQPSQPAPVVPYYLPTPVAPPRYQPAPAPRYQPAPTPYYQPAPAPFYQPVPSPYYQPAPAPYFQPSPYPMPYYNGPQPRYLEDLFGMAQPRDPMSEKKTGERVCPVCGSIALGADLVKTENSAGELVVVGCSKCLGVNKR